jgi:hypothetical protein
MKKTFCVALTLFFIAIVLELSSCKKCGPFHVNNFRIISFQSYMVKNDTDSVRQNDTVQFNDLKIAMYLDSVLYVRIITPVRYSLFNTAYACSPPTPASVNAIQRIEIYSDKNLSDTIPAGRDLSPYFSFELGDTYSIAGKITNQQLIDGYTTFYLHGLHPTFDETAFNSTYHQLTVRISLSDHTTQTFIYNKIYLTI